MRCFASVRELLGADTLEVELPEGSTLIELKEMLARRAPELERLPFACARNRDYCDPSEPLQDGDEIALIPPISGGSGAGEELRFCCRFTREVVDPRLLEQEVRTDHDGAVVTFTGVTRDHNEGQTVSELGYEAYVEMAVPVIERIFAAAAGRFPIGRARVVHRLGPVPVGGISICVVVAAPHRGAAFDACRYLMDRIKAEAPVFKRERLTDGSARWIGDLARPRSEPDAG